MTFKLSSRSTTNMIGVDPTLRLVAQRAIEITKVDFGIPSDGGYRTATRQRALYEEGKSKADGTEKLSKHQSGRALDFYAYVDGKASWEKEHLAQVACAFLQASLELGYTIRWGGLFRNFLDMPHVELVN